MANDKPQDHFSGPFCLGCDDAPESIVMEACDCAEARCIVPRCHLRVATEERSHGWPPVPVGMLDWRIKKGTLDAKMLVSPGWACSPRCLFAFVRSTHKADSYAKSSELAADALNALQEIYYGLGPTGKDEPRIVDNRIWRIAAADQLQTIREAAKIAHHESMETKQPRKL